MKQMHREPLASKARRAERRADAKSGLVAIKMDLKPSSSTSSGFTGGGFKRSGFKNAFAEEKTELAEEEVIPTMENPGMESSKEVTVVEGEESESDLEGGEDRYDPRRPTGCGVGCPGWEP